MTLASVTVTKPSPDCKLGITLGKRDGFVSITKISEDSLFANTDLKAGMRVLAVNGQKLTADMTTNEVITLMKSAESSVTIRAAEATPKGKTAAVPEQAAVPRKGASAPPPGCPEGGAWTTQKYHGGGSAACVVVSVLFFWPALLCLLCAPCDERRTYSVNGRLYDEEGKYLGPAPVPRK